MVSKKNTSKKSTSSNSKDIKNIIKKQSKQYNFRENEIKRYHKELIEKVNSKDLNKRKEELLSKEFTKEKITKEKLNNRTKRYGEKQTTFYLERWEDNKLHYVLRNKDNKIIKHIEEKPKLSKAKHKEIIYNKLKKEKFDYEKYYIPEDSEPQRKRDKRKEIEISYATYYRFGVLIYRLVNGRKYEVIFQSSDSVARSIYISYQRIIAELKEEILNVTNISLEEWIYLSRTSPNIHIEGGLSYKRFKSKHNIKDNENYKLDFEMNLDFERI